MKFLLTCFFICVIIMPVKSQSLNFSTKTIEQDRVTAARENDRELVGEELAKADADYQYEHLQQAYKEIELLVKQLNGLQRNWKPSDEQTAFDQKIRRLKVIENKLNYRNFFAAGWCCDPPGTWQATSFDNKPYIPPKRENFDIDDLDKVVGEIERHIEHLHSLDKRNK